ncbi:hypothetical protein AAF712_014060 [Marasmius tenuissimus]|uniref:Uncharacterized protein n=1 Tax=Marasmius tenuissimus TaxID=585030 RepID=A0ABR2ZDZ9_9AGAR
MSETPLRRSKRARKQTKYNDDSEDEDEIQRSRKLTTPTTGERQRTMRRKRGLLQRITEFPLDVVFDVNIRSSNPTRSLELIEDKQASQKHSLIPLNKISLEICQVKRRRPTRMPGGHV